MRRQPVAACFASNGMPSVLYVDKQNTWYIIKVGAGGFLEFAPRLREQKK
jgi:hypothetical protein